MFYFSFCSFQVIEYYRTRLQEPQAFFAQHELQTMTKLGQISRASQ